MLWKKRLTPKESTESKLITGGQPSPHINQIKMNQNKRIAEFMGLVVSDSANYTSELHTNVDVDLKYHTSWDWLMPVVSKIARDEEYFENEFSERLFDIVHSGASKKCMK